MKCLPGKGTVVLFICTMVGVAGADEVTVNSTNALRSAVSRATPGTTILIAPGNYSGGMHFRDVSGSAEARITIKGVDPDNPPVFQGGRQAMQLADCNYVTLANFVVDGCSSNGLNCDDGGSITTPMHHLVIENVTIRHIGPRGNHDGLKMSGVDQFIIGNAWYEIEGNRKPRLPGTETGSIYQVDPKLVDVGKPTMRITSEDWRLKDLGARAWKKLDAVAWIAGEKTRFAARG